MAQPASSSEPATAPRHIAIIMDGNGRWARQRGRPRTFGHAEGVEALRRTVEAAGELGVGYLTVFGFSTENWRRPVAEVNALFDLLRLYVAHDLDRLTSEGVRVRVIGERAMLQADIGDIIARAEDRTRHNAKLNLTIAFNYGGQDEIARATRRIAEDVRDGKLESAAINPDVFARYLDTAELPAPDLLVRTSGELRLSNFMLWQAAYTELVFVDVLWPDFGKAALENAIDLYRQRERRFGGRIQPRETASAQRARGDWSDLGPRILSSLVLASGGVAAAWFGGAWIAGACGAAVVVMSYEWVRMSEPEAITPAFMFALAGSLGAVMFASWGWLAYGAGWMALCACLSATRRRSIAGIIETAGGALYIGLPCAVFVWLRHQTEGLHIILSLFVIIWAADVFAYFGGKLIGGPKIAGGLSPNKTYSGIVAGVVAGAVTGFACGDVFGGTNAPAVVWSLVGVLIAFTGLMGDLFESFLKRRFGVKDASQVIPGHGGVLDRIDGLMAATLLTGAVVSAWPHVPAWLLGS